MTEYPWQEITLRRWDPSKHPRGPLGMFIDKDDIATTGGGGQLPLFSRKGLHEKVPTRRANQIRAREPGDQALVPPQLIKGSGMVEAGPFDQNAFDEATYIPRGMNELAQDLQTVEPGMPPTTDQRERIEEDIYQLDSWMDDASGAGQPTDVRKAMVDVDNTIRELQFDLANNPENVSSYVDEVHEKGQAFQNLIQAKNIEDPTPSSSSPREYMTSDDFIEAGGGRRGIVDEVQHVTRGTTDPIEDNGLGDYSASELASAEADRASMIAQLRDLNYTETEDEFRAGLRGDAIRLSNEYDRMVETRGFLERGEREEVWTAQYERAKSRMSFIAGGITRDTDRMLDVDGIDFVDENRADLEALRDASDELTFDPENEETWDKFRTAHNTVLGKMTQRKSQAQGLKESLAELPNPNAASIEQNAQKIIQARLDGDTSPINELLPVVEFNQFNAGAMAESVGLYTLEDGSKFVHKIDDEKSINNELGSFLVGEAVGAPVPKTIKVSDTEQIQQLAPGRMAIESEFDAHYGSYDEHDDAPRIATMDYLVMNVDRHEQNWMYDGDSQRITPIDNGHTFGVEDPPDAFERRYNGLEWDDPRVARGFWGNTPMPDSAILREWGDNLTNLKERFSREGLTSYWEIVMKRHRKLLDRVEEAEE